MDREDRSKRKSTPNESPQLERRSHRPNDDTASVRLIHKYADMIDGVNLEDAEVGDRLELPRHDAEVLIAEGWAERADERRVRLLLRRAQAADSTRRRKPKS